MSGKSHPNYGTLKNRDEEIAQMIEQGFGPYKIASLLGYDAASIKSRVKKIGLKFKEKVELDQYLEEILELRDNKISIRKIAEKFNTNHVTLSAFLKKNGQNTEKFIHKVDDDFFERIDNEYKAYCLGLIMSDGNLYKNRISLSMTDKDIIEKVKDCMKFSGYIHELPGMKSHHKNKYLIAITSTKMANDLHQYGIIPNKSLVLRFPNKCLIPDNLIHHLIRGIFDGDGCLCQAKKDKQWKITFTGTKEVLEGVEKYSNIKGQYDYIGKKTNSNTWHWSIRKRSDIYNFLQFMYKDANIYMDRKKILSERCLPPKHGSLEDIQLFLSEKGFNFQKESEFSTVIKHDSLKYIIEYLPFDRNNEQKYMYRQWKHYKSRNYKYICIYEDEWFNRQEQVKDFLLSKLNHFDKKIYARKCNIIEVEKKIAKQFINENHLQKVNNSGVINLGLQYENQLVGICQIRKHHRSNEGITISRICFLSGVQVIGGFSKLIQHSIKWCSNNGYDKVITWSDNRLTDGNSYEKAGFVKTTIYKSRYSYIHPNKPHYRTGEQNMQKRKLKLPVGIDRHLWIQKLGYQRLWDAGKTRFIYHIKSE